MTSAFAEELLQARQAGPEALQALAEKHLPLVGAMVKRYPFNDIAREELYQQGVIGLMKALKRFDPSRGTAFSTYAAALILGEIRMLHRRDTPLHIPRTETALRRRIRHEEDILRARLGREPTIPELAEALHMDAAELMLHMDDLAVASCDAPGPSGTPLWELLSDPEDFQRRLELRDILSRLPAQDRQLILLRYRLGLTQSQAGQRLRMSQMQISRREKAIRRLLRETLQES